MAKFFDESNKMKWRMGRGKRQEAERHNKIHEQGMQDSDLMEDARKKIKEQFLENPATLKILNSNPTGKDEKEAKEGIEKAVKAAKADLDSYNRHRWGMQMVVDMEKDGRPVLCPYIFWKWRSSTESKSDAAGAEEKGKE